MKRIAMLLLSAVALAKADAAPLQWICDWPEAKSQTFSLYQGETATFEPTFRVNGRAVTNATIEAVWYQTNGMANAWWKLDGATFAPSNDVGAAAYRFFVEAKASGDTIYRANGALRMLPSPGFTPNAIEPPIVTLDFNTIEVVNAPWTEIGERATGNGERLDALEPQVATNAANIASLSSQLSRVSRDATNYTDTAISQIVIPEPDFTSANETLVSTIEAVAPAPGDYANVSNKAMTALQSYTETDPAWSAAKSGYVQTSRKVAGKSLESDVAIYGSDIPQYNGASQSILDGLVSASSTASEALYVANQKQDELTFDREPTENSANPVTSGGVKRAISAAAQSATNYTDSATYSLSSQVSAISGHLNAEDARFVSTNYNSEVHLPEASVEVSISNEWLTVWREMTRWDAFTGTGFNWTTWGGFYAWMTNTESALDQKADRAWGYYDSHTGEWAPEGYTQVSSSNILIAAGMGYQRTVSSGHTYWVLTANEPYEVSGISSNGFFRVADADGNVLCEIIKGDKRTVPAPPDGVSASGGVLTVSYPVASQPKVEVSLTLADGGTWHAEDSASCPATVAWSGTSGAYVATVTPSAPTAQLFVKASYQVGGETFINNRAPISITGGIYFNGTLYMPTVSGNELKFIAQ